MTSVLSADEWTVRRPQNSSFQAAIVVWLILDKSPDFSWFPIFKIENTYSVNLTRQWGLDENTESLLCVTGPPRVESKWSWLLWSVLLASDFKWSYSSPLLVLKISPESWRPHVGIRGIYLLIIFYDLGLYLASLGFDSSYAEVVCNVITGTEITEQLTHVLHSLLPISLLMRGPGCLN